MRVLTFTNLFPNSRSPNHGIFVAQRMAAFAALGHEVTVISPVPYLPPLVRLAKYEKFRGIRSTEEIFGLRVHHPRYIVIPGFGMGCHGHLMFRSAERVVRRLHAEKPFDLVDAHYVYPDGYAAMRVSESIGVPLAVSARGTDINVFPDMPKIKPLIEQTLNAASLRIAVSRELAARMTELCGKQVVVIENGVDMTTFIPVEKTEARKHLGIPGNSRMLLSVGELGIKKGHDLLIETMNLMKERVPDVRLYVVGEGAGRHDLESQITKLGLKNSVFLAGSSLHRELRYWFSAADVSVLASAREGWPNVVMESLACGTPVVASAVGAVPEILSSPMLGRTVENRTPAAFASALEEALHAGWDPQVIRAHISRFTWKSVAERLEEAFRTTTGAV